MDSIIITLLSQTSFMEHVLRDIPTPMRMLVSPQYFPDGEFFVRIPENIRNKTCYLVASITPQNVFEILVTIDTLKRACAKKVILVTPYLPYSRQDRRADTRTPISAKVLANMLETAGVDHVITMDVHALQIEGFYDIPFDNLQGATLLVDAIVRANRVGEDYIFVAPDAGAAKRTKFLAELYDKGFAILDKKRISSTEVESLLVGNVKGKKCIMIDDIIASGSTMKIGAEVLKENGATEVFVGASHLLWNDHTTKNLQQDRQYGIDQVTVLNTVGPSIDFEWIKQLNCSKVFVEAIIKDSQNESISSMFNQKK